MVYLPPRSSLYSDTDLFNQLEDDILQSGIDNNNFLLCGDFTSHVGVKSDILEIDTLEGVNDNVGVRPEIYEQYNAQQILHNLNITLKRGNQDKLKLDDYRRRLLELCQRTSICLLNGRVGDDENVGKVTTKHDTVVDYMIGSLLLLQHIEHFEIEDFNPIFSDVYNM